MPKASSRPAKPRVYSNFLKLSGKTAPPVGSKIAALAQHVAVFDTRQVSL